MCHDLICRDVAATCENGDRSAALRLFETLYGPRLDFDNLEMIIKNPKDCEEVPYRSTKNRR